ncbi:MAG: hypothetical protein HYU25_08345 [Candidatus Rokubacteria bacterium]|nr:hypothetical protein [Candidatus Rokubacteria bacterium]
MSISHEVGRLLNPKIPPCSREQDEVARAHLEGRRRGLKGITIYRSGSKAVQVLTLGVDEDPTARGFFAECDPGACRL